jgi:flagellar M-ring protein FliF
MTNALAPTVVDAVRRMNGTRRFLGLGIIAGALALLWVGSRWAAGPSYVTLYRDLELSGAGSITDNLTKNGIAYRLDDGGSTVLVAQADVARARVMLAKDGLPANGRPGLELFDKPSWGMTDFTQRITYRRALEGELSRTIGTLRGVERAQVHLALPESSPLRKLERPAEAAVVVSLKPGFVLGPEVVQGIAYIVSNSVEQLPADNVAVMDDSGRLLSVPADNGGFYGLTTRQLDLQRSVEHQLAEKAEGMLATVVGAGQSRVQVSAQLNFEQVDKTVESYDPDGAVLGTEQRSETTPEGDDGSGAGSQTIVSNSYQNSKKVERIIGSVGNINRLSVAVLVNQRAIGTTPIAGLESAVRNAIGIDSARGDRLTMTAMPFEIDPAAALKSLAADTASKRDMLVVVERFSRPGIMVLGIVAALILGLKLLKPVAIPAGTAALAAGAVPAAPALPSALPELPAAPPSMSMQLRNRIQADSADSPNTAAQVMRAWLAES